MAARRRTVGPRIRFTAGLPLSRNPPASHLLGPGWILEVEDHHDIADVAFRGGGDIGIPPVEIVAVHSFTMGSPFAEQLWARRCRYIVDAEPAAEIRIAILSLALMIDHHDAVCDAH